MSLHKLTAGNGYTYLTRQVAAADATDLGHTSLGEFYAQKGESPGEWVGAGLCGLDGIDLAGPVSAEQMKALFGHGRHPNADSISAALVAAGNSPAQARAATALGKAFAIYDRVPPFRIEVAARFAAYNQMLGVPGNATVPADVRARIRTEVGMAMFTEKHERPPSGARELSGFIARSSQQATTAVAGYDLTFSPVKSISALWAVAPAEVAAQIQEAHQGAVASALRWLERDAVFTRAGSSPQRRQIEVTGLVGVAFVHRDSRSGDPDLHTHVAISNKVQTHDGLWRALDGRVLFKAAAAASARYDTRIEAELTARLGVGFTPRPGGDPSRRAVREIAGFDLGLCKFWSSRRADIVVRLAVLSGAFQVDHGRPPTAIESIHLAQQATLETRQAKHSPRSYKGQRATWAAQGAQVLGSQAAVVSMVTAATGTGWQGQKASDAWVGQAAARVVATLSGSRSTWQVWHVRGEAERVARGAGIALGQVDAVVDQVVAGALSPTHSIRLAAPEPVAEPALLRRSDGTSVYTMAGSALFTSQAVMDGEATLVAVASRTGGPAVADEVVEAALAESAANGVTLNPSQAQLVREMATCGARLQLAIAPAGSGKTTAMAVLARAWTDGGGTVIGLAPSAVAAAVLGAQIGARFDTLSKLTWSLTHTPVPGWVSDIDENTLVIIDEAGMAGTTDLAAAVSYITGKGGAVRLVGDDQQLASVAAGGVLADIAQTAGAVTLSELMRFQDPAEGAASLALRSGDTAGIGFYLDNDRVHVGDLATAADAAYRAWSADRGAGLDSIMLAPTRHLVAALNARARTDRILAAPGPVGAQAGLADGNQASAGDTIITRANERALATSDCDWVKNGDRWKVTRVHPGGALGVQHLGSARRLTLPAPYVSASTQLGYASTVHGAQGVTTDTAHAVATGNESRQLLYVAMTRGRTGNHVYLCVTGDGEPRSVIKPATVRPPTAADILGAVLARDERHPSATTSARELACPQSLLEHAAGRYQDSLGVIAQVVVGADLMDGLDSAAEELHEGLSASAAYPTLRAHLATLAAGGQNAIAALSIAAGGRDLAAAADPAATLDWHLDFTTRASPDQLPWLPGLPAAVSAHEQYGPYLNAQADLIARLVIDVQEGARAYTPTTAPAWAAHLLDPEHQQLLGDLAVWRAATGVSPLDRRPTGPPQHGPAAARAQHGLDSRTAAAQGDPHAPVRQWMPLATRLGLDTSADPFWPELAERLSSLHGASRDVTGMLTAAVAERPLPDEQAAAALWWRLSRHLSPAALSATGGSGAATLRPWWTRDLVATLGALRAERVMADPAWPALAATVNAALDAGWAPGQLLGDMFANSHDDTIGGHRQLLPASLLAEALVWRVAALTDPEPLQGFEPPPDPADNGETHDLHLLGTDQHKPHPPASPVAGALLTMSTTEPCHDELAPQDDCWQEALFHASRQRQCAPAPDFGHLRTERQLVEANRWDHAPVTRARLLQLNAMAADFFAAGYPRSWGPAYVIGRLGTDLADHDQYRPGYAPRGWTTLRDHLRAAGVGDDEIIAAGLGRVASTGRLIDQFRGRLVLPIRSGDQIHGFIGRRHPDQSGSDKPGPKYLNTPRTDLFDKGAQLFGLSEERVALNAGATPVLVEGLFDAIAVTLAGRGRHVGLATLGTSITAAQADQLRLYVGPGRRSVSVATDADLAGEIAAQRAYWMLSAWGAAPHHVRLVGGLDPAEVLADGGPGALAACLDDAQPLAWHLLAERLASLGGSPAIIGTCAAIIAAGPPHTWAEHIDYVTARSSAGRGAMARAVASAAQGWTRDPLASAQAQISDLWAVQARLRPSTPISLPLEQACLPVVVAGSGAKPPLRDADQSSPANCLGPAPVWPRFTGKVPAAAWELLAASIDPRLTAGQDWPILARAIQEADAAGYDVAHELAQLAADRQACSEQPATELAYRLRAASATFSDVEPSPDSAAKQVATSSPRRSQEHLPPARQRPGRPVG